MRSTAYLSDSGCSPALAPEPNACGPVHAVATGKPTRGAAANAPTGRQLGHQHSDEDVDHNIAGTSALPRRRCRRRCSKAALIRQCVAQHFRPLPRPEDDPLAAFLGASDDDPVDDIDAVVYGG
ncbi:MAG: hypothetical protein L0H84_20110 [Pseudonocardia sp.]|nr:hypothetical protein [Pseudonocardia sp.]